jgi:hypothetical protein
MKISEIRDIVRIAGKYSKENVLALTQFPENSNLSAFMEIIAQGEISNEQEVAYEIFGESVSSTHYKSMKSYLVSKVVQQLISIDLSSSELSEYAKALFKAYKYLFVVRTLLSLGNRAAAIHFAKRLLKLADKFEFYIVSIALLQELRAYAVQVGNEAQHQKYLLDYERKIELLKDESTIKSLEEKVLIHFTKSLFVDEKFRSEIVHSLKIVSTILAKRETYLSRLANYRLHYVYYQVKGKPLRSAHICQQAIKYMEGRPHMSPPSRLAEFALYELENYILARDFSQGKKAIAYCESKINSGMMLWFTFKQYHFLLMMQTTQFTEASKIFEEVTAHERYDSLSSLIKERWALFGLYIKYVTQSNGIRSVHDETTPSYKKSYLVRDKKFKEGMLNFPTYKKDKRGLNVAILTLNILVALEENKLDLLLRQEEALSSYRFKYLNEKHCHQSFVLFKLIRLMTKNDFELSRIEKKASAIEKDLHIAEVKPGEVFENIQILPAEWVWQRIKTILSKGIKK